MMSPHRVRRRPACEFLCVACGCLAPQALTGTATLQHRRNVIPAGTWTTRLPGGL
jgi:hypothetical protein